jgi:hypothetical protein
MKNPKKVKELFVKTNQVKIKYGYEDEAGREVIPVIYSLVSDFRGGYAVVVDDETRYRKFIDTTGKIIYSLECDLASEPIERKTIFQKNDKWGIVDIITGKIIIPCEYDKLSWLNDDYDGETIWNNQILIYDELEADEQELLIKAEKDGKCGVFNMKGKSIMLCKYDDIILENDYDEICFLMAKHEGKWGVFDIDGEIILSCAYDEMGVHWNDDYKWEHYLLSVKKNGKWGVINMDGKIIVPFDYDKILIYDDAIYMEDYWEIEEMEKTLFEVVKDKKLGVINWNGEIVLQCEYDRIEFVSDEVDKKIVITFKKGKKWGLIEY